MQWPFAPSRETSGGPPCAPASAPCRSHAERAPGSALFFRPTACRQCSSTSRWARLPSTPGEGSTAPAHGFQTARSPSLQSSNAPSYAPAAPSHSPPAFHLLQKIRSPRPRHIPSAPAAFACTFPPRAATPPSHMVQLRHAGCPHGDGFPSADKTPPHHGFHPLPGALQSGSPPS